MFESFLYFLANLTLGACIGTLYHTWTRVRLGTFGMVFFCILRNMCNNHWRYDRRMIPSVRELGNICDYRYWKLMIEPNIKEYIDVVDSIYTQLKCGKPVFITSAECPCRKCAEERASKGS